MAFTPKPPTSVRSIRLPDETWAKLAARAEKRGIKVNALVAEMIGAGLAAKRVEPVLTKVTVEPETMKALQRTHSRATLRKPLEITGEGENKMRMPRAPVGSRLKGSKK